MHSLCCLFAPPPPNQLSNDGTNLYESWATEPISSAAAAAAAA
jgi:hypothetical protein